MKPAKRNRKWKGNEKRRMLDEYFEKFGDGEFAPCQACGGHVRRDQADWAHKEGDGRGGPLTAENGLCLHGFRKGPVHCHGWADRKEGRIQVMIQSWANLTNGKKVKWEDEQWENLKNYLRTGSDPHNCA